MRRSFARAINPDGLAGEIEHFLTGRGSAVEPDVPAAPVFTDIGDSTKRATMLGNPAAAMIGPTHVRSSTEHQMDRPASRAGTAAL
jgi:hypothetical protein